MKVLNDYVCNLGHITERYVEPDAVVNCPVCEGLCQKELSYPALFKKDGKPIDIMSDKWARVREKNYIRNREQNG